MFKTIQESVKKSAADYPLQSRTEWLTKWPSMVILCVNQITWTYNSEKAIETNGLLKFEEEMTGLIMDVVSMVRQTTDFLIRKTLSAVITLDVHARDIITDIKNKKIPDIKQFD